MRVSDRYILDFIQTAKDIESIELESLMRELQSLRRFEAQLKAVLVDHLSSCNPVAFDANLLNK